MLKMLKKLNNMFDVPNQRAANRVRKTFAITDDVEVMLADLAKATQRSPTQVLEILIAQEHSKRSGLGQLQDVQPLFPEPPPAPQVAPKRRRKS